MRIITIIALLLFAQIAHSGTVTNINKARLQRKYAGILGTFTNTELQNINIVSDEKIDDVQIIITQTKITEENGEYKLTLSHWVEGKVVTTLSLPISSLDATKSFEGDTKSIRIESGEGEHMRIVGEDRALDIENDVAKILIGQQDSESIRLIDPYIFKNDYYSGLMNRIDHLPRVSAEGGPDRSSIMHFIQLDMQSRGVKSEVALTDFFKGQYEKPQMLQSCRMAFN